MAINLNREGVALNAEERNKRNQNWTTIEQEVAGIGSNIADLDQASSGAVGEINKLKVETAEQKEGLTAVNTRVDNVVIEAGEAAFDKVIDASKLEWQEPVATFADLATTYPDATEAFTSQTTSDGSVYRFNGSEWKKIQQVDAGPINEVDTRLTAQLAEIAFSVKTFGAIGNGQADDTIAIQKTIDQAASRGAEVFFPSGIYKISNRLILPRGTVLKGDKATLKLADNTPLEEYKGTILWIDGVSDVKVRNLEFDGNKSNQSSQDSIHSQRAIAIVFSDNIDIQGNYFHDFKHQSVVVKAQTQGQATSKGVQGLVVNNNKFIDTWSALVITESDSKHINFTNNLVENCQEHGISTYPGNSYVHIEGNTIRNIGLRTMNAAPAHGLYNYGSGIRILETIFATVANNIVENPRRGGINISSNATLTLRRSQYVTVTGNIVLGGERKGDYGNGIEVTSDNSVVSGNIVKDYNSQATTSGILVEGSDNTIVGNQVINSKEAGITLKGNSHSVNSNTLIDPGKYGIMLGGTAAASKISVSNNSISKKDQVVERGIYAQSNVTEITMMGNVFKDVLTQIAYFSGQLFFINGNFVGTAPPTTGTFNKGDRVLNSNPVVGQPKSWVCLYAGTPGTWVSEGNL